MRAGHDGTPVTPARTTRRGFIALAAVTAVGVTASCAPGGAPAPRDPAPSALERRQVWAHMVPQGLPLAADPDVHYGSERPLSLAPAGTGYERLVADQLTQARAAGLTGMQILLLDGVNSGTDFVADWMSAADPSWRNSSSAGFSVAPCLQVSSLRRATSMVEQYAAAAAEHPSAARSGDALVVWVYNARSLSPGDWNTLRGTLHDRGTDVFLVAELKTQASQHGDTLDTSLVDPYAGSFDALWLFEDKETEVLHDVVSWAAAHDLPFAGGSLPGYDRQTAHGGYVDARGTELWRRHLESQLAAHPAWLTAVTWNDAVEHTSVQPTTDWGRTRADLLAHHSAVFRGAAQEDSEARAYASSPQYLLAGRELLVEGLVINHGHTAVRVRTRVTSAAGRTLAEAVSEPVAAGGVTAAVVERTLDLRGGEHVVAVVDLLDEKGARTAGVRGAPVVVYDEADPAVPSPDRRRYYSLGSHETTDFSGVARLERGEGPGPSGMHVTTTRAVRSVELLHNTWPAGLALDATGVGYEDPPGSIVGGQEVSTVPGGFTIARVVTHEGRIAYSAPVHHGASGG